MVDIFEVAPQSDGTRTPATAYTGHEAKMTRYQNLISKLSADDEPADGVYVDWLPQQEVIELGSNGKDDDKPLVGTFADAAAAMV